MIAREMFEKLGYEFNFDSDNFLLQPCISYFKYNDEEKKVYSIRFWTKGKVYEIENNKQLSLDLVQAINKQVEELGWNNESI